jgi:hypothetical protein
MSDSNTHTPANTAHNTAGPAAKAGALLFLLWSILHIWVGFEGVHQYLTQGTPGLWNLVIGGSQVPRSAFQHTQDATTAFAQGQLLLNFCIDVAGYGVLGLGVAWLLWARASWLGYVLGLVVIGIADMTFLLAMVTSGVIAFSVETISGPVIWFLAILITPFGLPMLKHR